jgi:hypothetical protein
MLIIEANYAKKVGLPAYSSHQFAVTLRTELTDLSQLERTVAELYQRLQAAVDTQIINPGLVPTANGAMATPAPQPPTRAPAAPPPAQRTEEPQWRCSDKQRDLILKIVAENGLDKSAVEQLAQTRFGTGVRELNKLQASSLIDELLESHTNLGARHGGRARPTYTGRASR